MLVAGRDHRPDLDAFFFFFNIRDSFYPVIDCSHQLGESERQLNDGFELCTTYLLSVLFAQNTNY